METVAADGAMVEGGVSKPGGGVDTIAQDLKDGREAARSKVSVGELEGAGDQVGSLEQVRVRRREEVSQAATKEASKTNKTPITTTYSTNRQPNLTHETTTFANTNFT